MFACMRAYRCNNPGDCWCIGCENNTAVVLTKQPDVRAPSRQLRERDNYFPSSELRILFLPRSPRISSPARALETGGRLLKKAELYVTVQPWIFALCNPGGFPVRTRGARLVSPCAWELCCQGRNFHFNFLLSKVWMWHEMRYGSRANWYLINVWPDWRAQAHLPHVSSNMHDLQAGSLPQQTFHAMRSMNVKRRK